jgi:hypothetical protein
MTAYYPGRVANTLADTRDRAGSMFDNNVKLAWDNIPEGLRPKAERDNVNELVFSKIGSKYIISATKSEPVDVLHVSEAPYFADDGKITEAEQMLRRHGIEIMESTAFGVGNLFEKRFMEAWLARQAGRGHHRIALFFPWYTDPKNTVDVHPELELKNAAFIADLAERVLVHGQRGGLLGRTPRHARLSPLHRRCPRPDALVARRPAPLLAAGNLPGLIEQMYTTGMGRQPVA